MERREELLQAAARVYALHGYRGSTTRRIADEAGVNEITIFRQFGTKDALIHEAISQCSAGAPPSPLPDVPVDPFRELRSWAATFHRHIASNKSLIRRCLSEREEHPQLSASANKGPLCAATELRRYLTKLREHGFTDGPFEVDAAAAMFMGTIFADGMGRDVMPHLHPTTQARAIEQYTRLLLRGIGVDVEHTAAQDAEHVDA